MQLLASIKVSIQRNLANGIVHHAEDIIGELESGTGIRGVMTPEPTRSSTHLRVIKYPDRAEAGRFYNFPYEAIEEALANAVYHRGYDVREPIEVRISPDKPNSRLQKYRLTAKGRDLILKTENRFATNGGEHKG